MPGCAVTATRIKRLIFCQCINNVVCVCSKKKTTTNAVGCHFGMSKIVISQNICRACNSFGPTVETSVLFHNHTHMSGDERRQYDERIAQCIAYMVYRKCRHQFMRKSKKNNICVDCLRHADAANIIKLSNGFMAGVKKIFTRPESVEHMCCLVACSTRTIITCPEMCMAREGTVAA